MRQGSANQERADPPTGAGPLKDEPRPTASDSGSGRSIRRWLARAVALILVVAVGLVIVLRTNRPTQAPGGIASASKQAVEQAYLAYWGGLNSAHVRLDLRYVTPFLTVAGREQEQTIFTSEAQAGVHYELVADHSAQTQVFSDGSTAAVDDVLVEHRIPVDAVSLNPTGPDQPVVLHNSYALRLQAKSWLVDSVVSFGSDHSGPLSTLSYAATDRTAPPSAQTQQEIGNAFIRYWTAESVAYRTDDPASLTAVETNPALAKETVVLQRQGQAGKAWLFNVEHNYRIGQKDDSTAVVYDTYLDGGHAIAVSSGKALPSAPPSVLRQSYEFINSGGEWKIDQITGFN